MSTCAARVPDLGRLLSPDETARAKRFRFDADHDRFVLARGMLRTLLAEQLATRPEAVVLAYTDHGKPVLAPAHASDLHFNVSHSGDRVLVALARGLRVGVDVELVKPGVAHDEIAAQFFTPGETASIRRLPAAEQAGRFYDHWVRKEAASKAWGMGFSLDLDSFDVSTDAALAGRLECPPGILPGCRSWSIRMLDAGPGYHAAIVTEGDSAAVEPCRWPID